MTKPLYGSEGEKAIMQSIWDPQVALNPEAFVLFAFPWGKKGTPLENYSGPRTWQREVLRDIHRHVVENVKKGFIEVDPDMFRLAVASGRGIGKSALVAWLTLWLQSTALGSTVIVTANTEAQLKSRTWAELGKWHTMMMNGHWFERTALSLRPAPWFEELLKTQLKLDTGYYYAQAQLWSEENPDSFAGVHNPHGVMVIKDEASGIPLPIWKVTEGFFTEPVRHRYWFAFSNPRRNTGAFFECFHKDRNFWRTKKIDSRTVEGTDRSTFQRMVDQYGEDSDTVRVEVKGEFPRQGDNQFISTESVDKARRRDVVPDAGAALVMGVDVARFGDDRSVICFRQGRDARSIVWKEYRNLDLVQLPARVAELADRYNPDAIFVDEDGMGGGVVDRLKEMKYRVIGVQSGSSADDADRFPRKRVEMWWRMREWLEYGCIPDSSELADDILGPEYSLDLKGRYNLETKDQMKKRGLASPDYADALAMTFARPIARRDLRSGAGRRAKVAKDVDYKIL
jgi:hypothetical protein